jgi:hypothetical protein
MRISCKSWSIPFWCWRPLPSKLPSLHFIFFRGLHHFVSNFVAFFADITSRENRYAELGIFSVISIGILTLFYHGMLNLAKVFLDPLDNEDYSEGCVYLDLAVLIREANTASTRWMRGVAPP